MSPVLLLSLIWLVPPLAWVPQADATDDVLIAMVLLGLMSGATVTLSSVPPAAICYLSLLTVGCVLALRDIGSPAGMTLAAVFGLALIKASLWNAGQLISHLRARMEVEEQATMLSLLREFEASGSDWLWELDAELKIKHLSRELVQAAGRPASRLLGVRVLDILDPAGRVSDVSFGMRELVRALGSREPFRDLAVPAKSGQAWWSFSGKPLFHPDGSFAGWRGVGSDVTAVRLTGNDSVRAARHDPLTGLGNRLLLREQLEEALLRQSRGRGSCALLLVDLDRFKLVNDTLGHAVGDQLLCEVADRLEESAGCGDVGRIGGDEFAVVVNHVEGPAALARFAEEIIGRLSAPYRIGEAQLNVGATIGIAAAPEHGTSQEELTRSADLALYSAKAAGRGSWRFFEAWMADDAAAQRQLESDLRRALPDGELQLAYQPIVDAEGQQVVAREALLRWNHRHRGDVPPSTFVPVIEDVGLMVPVGNWVLREACQEAAGWNDNARVAVNISAAQLAGGGLAATVLSALAGSGLSADRLELELTESIFLADDPQTRSELARLRAIGVRLVLDDFGTGYSSYGCLIGGDFSKIKIDRSFVGAAAAGNREARSIVQSVLTLARGMDLEVTAEGIETPEQAEALKRLGCGQLQGFLFGRPELSTKPSASEQKVARLRPHAA
jgi:diguanylate cyclase (GGDEF)-like protein